MRCGKQYRKDGTFPIPQQMHEIASGEVVLAHEVVDFQREQPSWRLYMVSHVMTALSEAPEWQNPYPVRNAYEAFFRQTTWGALFFATTHMGPVSAERTAARLQAVLRFWEPLQSARYLFSTPNATHSLEELMEASCGWAMNAWCPTVESSVRARLETATKRMAQATREDCIEAILRQMPRALSSARGLKHPRVLAEPSFQRERLCSLEPALFEHVSGACTADLLEKLYEWDRELGMQ
ncbi:hypothetical protein BON30_24620 [Cystobacter ferrugineus]|uniref:Uncharacterized protein n=1 Tax=Cystobacter ferrugineus TaxID=83449 RepID=A0A1L9B7Z0_9BACT|nr:hypothetical protein BON30_24620 [Cystobacter ferrugineus]